MIGLVRPLSFLRACLPLLASLALSCDAVDGPVIDQVTPSAAPRGATVRIDGSLFCVEADGACSPAAGDVTFGLDPQVGAVIVRWSATSIDVVVPSSAPIGSTDIVVTTHGRSSGATAFEVLP